MNLHEHFLPTDMVEASKQYSCFKDCLELVTKHLNEGQIELAKLRAVDVLNSLHELSMLAEKKNVIDRRGFMIDQLNWAGVHIQVIRSLQHER